MTFMELTAGPAALMLLGLGVAVLVFVAVGVFAPVEKYLGGRRLAVGSTYGAVLTNSSSRVDWLLFLGVRAGIGARTRNR
ncbi:Uncharacterised protein [Mycobacteroides abscessus]|uniref:Uncharacterized protein n=1 Tax=Mycobacteroides abscessus TaxID=36809 RepID=A0A0U0ZQT5_9MYCO|nr:Uncharacterised protein [Mycobacteroides abscessus]